MGDVSEKAWVFFIGVAVGRGDEAVAEYIETQPS